MHGPYSMVVLSGLGLCLGACGRAPLVGAHGGGTLGFAGATATGGADVVATGGAIGTGGTTTTDTTCVAVAQAPANAVAICTFTGGEGEAYGCDKLPVRIALDSASYYFVTDGGRNVARCPRDRANPVATLSMETYSEGVYHLLSGEILPSGLVSLGCAIHDPAGPGGGYWYACSGDGIQIVQPGPKYGNLYLQFPGPESDAGTTGYQGRLDGYPHCLHGDGDWWPSPITYRAMSDGAVLGEQPITCWPDDRTMSFLDLDGRLVTIAFGDNYQLTDVQLRPSN